MRKVKRMAGKWRWNSAQLAERKWWQLYLKNKDVSAYLNWKVSYWKQLLASCKDLVIKPDDRILDAGCGPAGVFMCFPNHDTVVAFDPLMEAYENDLPHFKKTMYPNVQFVQCGIEDFQWPGLFSKVFCMNAINHVRDIQLSFSRLCSMTSPGGQLIVTIDAHNHGLFKHLFRMLPGDILHPHQFDLEEYKNMITQHGLKLIDVLHLKHEFFFDHYALIAEKPLFNS